MERNVFTDSLFRLMYSSIGLFFLSVFVQVIQDVTGTVVYFLFNVGVGKFSGVPVVLQDVLADVQLDAYVLVVKVSFDPFFVAEGM